MISFKHIVRWACLSVVAYATGSFGCIMGSLRTLWILAAALVVNTLVSHTIADVIAVVATQRP